MLIPGNIIANADDLGYGESVNKGILQCFEQGYINSTSLMTNMEGFDEAIDLIRANPVISNIGVHVNLAEGKPLTDFKEDFLDADGNFAVWKTNKVLLSLNTAGKTAFAREINAQIEKALAKKIGVIHMDSHLHLHTLPAFYKLFAAASTQHKLKIRLAQTYNEGSYIKFYYRKYINSQFKKNDGNYSDRFETVERFLEYKDQHDKNIKVEVMLHPWVSTSGMLEDHFDKDTLTRWITFLKNQ
ncbi:MAG TPA: ChbG/HpnK family deacetylase [Mucilaginibacter sp.]|nr:ChbG/HpnK family deacetylase [Mucilaginibacter sp.]